MCLSPKIKKMHTVFLIANARFRRGRKFAEMLSVEHMRNKESGEKNSIHKPMHK